MEKEPLTCSRCSTFKVPLITVSTSSDLVPQVMDDDSEMFTFDSCRSNCSSSRDHINSSITLVVTGLCNPPPRSSTFDLLSRMHKTKFYSQHRLISSKSTSHHKAQKRPKPSSEPQQPSPETTGILAPPPLSPHQVKVPLPPVLFTPPPPLYHPPPHQLPNEAEEEQDEEVEYNNLMDEEHFQLKLLQQQQQQQPPQQIQRFQTPSTLYTRRDFYTTTTPTTIPQSASQPPVLPRFNEIVAASTTSAINTTTPTPSPTPAPPTPLSSTTTTDTRAAPTTAASLVATTTAATRAAPTLASSLRRVDSPPTPTEQRRSPTNKS
ncbi:hypothetical protein Pelo_13147 [Pelomyxa schiedti]|nr:hypothetical protein Pelo_13147 [Pelomyxa schiedti]